MAKKEGVGQSGRLSPCLCEQFFGKDLVLCYTGQVLLLYLDELTGLIGSLIRYSSR